MPKISIKIHNNWKAMMNRCYSDKNIAYEYYKGKGIIVCDRWHDEQLFCQDMLPSFKPGLTLDRIDGNGNYEPSNCQWITMKEQVRKRNNTILYEYKGRKQICNDWATEYGISKNILYYRLSSGMDIETALNKPIKNTKCTTLGNIICPFCKKEVVKNRTKQVFCSVIHRHMYYSSIKYKQIIVPFSEFIEQGGVLIKGREVFNNEGLIIGLYLDRVSDDLLICENHPVKSFEVVANTVFIKINTKPIYK